MKDDNGSFVRLLFAFALFGALAACGRHAVSFVVVQNGLEVETTVHRRSEHHNERIFTIAVQDAASKRPVTDARVGIAPAGAASSEALNEGNGSYKLALDEPPGSSADINVAVLADHRTVFFKLKRP